MAERVVWGIIGGVCLIFGGASLTLMAHNDRGSNRLLIEDQGDAFFVAMAVAEIVLGFIAIAAAVPGIDTGARRIFGVLLGGAVAVGLAWGSVTAFRRTLRLVTKTAADVTNYGVRPV